MEATDKRPENWWKRFWRNWNAKQANAARMEQMLEHPTAEGHASGQVSRVRHINAPTA